MFLKNLWNEMPSLLKKKKPVYLIVNVHAMQISQILTDFPCLGSDLQLRSST